MVDPIRGIESHRNVLSLGETWPIIQRVGHGPWTYGEEIVDRETLKRSEERNHIKYWFGQFGRKDSRQKLGSLRGCSGTNSKEIQERFWQEKGGWSQKLKVSWRQALTLLIPTFDSEWRLCYLSIIDFVPILF